MRGLEGRVVIVTGGGGGIGGATVRRFADEGAKVAVLDREGGAAATVSGTAPGSKAYACDITDYDGVAASVTAVEAEFGPVDVLVNNAGWDLFKPFVATEPEDWQQLIAINLVGVLNMIHVTLPGMVERGYGRIVSVASDAARVGSSGEAVYAACKAGMLGLSKTLAREHARHGVTVNVVCPGPTETNLLAEVTAGSRNPEKLQKALRRAIPMGRLGQPDDLPGAICFFASDDAGFVTGQVLSVSGGLTMAG